MGSFEIDVCIVRQKRRVAGAVGEYKPTSRKGAVADFRNVIP